MTGNKQQALNAHGPVHKSLLTVRNYALSYSIVISALLLFSILFTSCKQTPTEASAPPVLKLEEVSCTEAWYRLTAHGYKLPLQAEVYRDNKLTTQFTVNTFEKIFYIDSLLPKHNYTVSVSLTAANGEKTTLSENIVTMDTTSHSIQWKYWLFGTKPTSCINDIAITENGKVGAACEVYAQDSTKYGYFNWIEKDGEGWKLKRILFLSPFPGNPKDFPFTNALVKYGNDKLLVNGGHTNVFWNGDSVCGWFLQNQSVLRYWKTDDNNIYGSTYAGNIVHYDGDIWTTMKTGTNVPLSDITGDMSGEMVYACGYTYQGRSVVYQLKNGKLSEFWSESNPSKLLFSSGNIITTCTVVGKQVYFAGSTGKIYQMSLLDTSIIRIMNYDPLTASTPYKLRWLSKKIRGCAANDIFLLDFNNELWHYNGFTWKQIEEVPLYMQNTLPFSLLTGAEEIYFTGNVGIYGFIIHGRRI